MTKEQFEEIDIKLTDCKEVIQRIGKNIAKDFASKADVQVKPLVDDPDLNQYSR